MLSAETTAQHIVISEIRLSGGTGKTSDEFVELYNPTDVPIDITNWQLVKYTKSGISASSTLAVFGVGSVVPAHGFWLAAHVDYVVIQSSTADTFYHDVSLADDNSVAFINNEGKVIDLVGWGKASLFEGAAISSMPTSIFPSLERLPGLGLGYGQDTDNNASDFIRSTSSPHNSHSTAEPTMASLEIVLSTSTQNNLGAIEEDLPLVSSSIAVLEMTPVDTFTPTTSLLNAETVSSSAASLVNNISFVSTTPVSMPSTTESQPVKVGDIVINEFLSDPGVDGEEFVELYNITSSTIDLEGWKIVDGSGAKTELSGLISAEGYTVIVKPHGSLNNMGDQITLYASSTVIDTVSYGDWNDGSVENNAPVARDAWSVARKINGVNTGNDLLDFAITTDVTKGFANSIRLPAPAVVPMANSNINNVDTVVHSSTAVSGSTTTNSIATTTKIIAASTTVREKKLTPPPSIREEAVNNKINETVVEESKKVKKTATKIKKTSVKKVIPKISSLQTVYGLGNNTKIVVQGVFVAELPGGFLLTESNTGTMFAVVVKASAARIAGMRLGDEISFQANVRILKTGVSLQTKSTDAWKIVGKRSIPEPQTILLSELDEDFVGMFVRVAGQITDSGGGLFYLDDNSGEAAFTLTKAVSKNKGLDKNDRVQVIGVVTRFADGIPQIIPIDRGVEKINTTNTPAFAPSVSSSNYQWPIFGLGMTGVGAGWWFKKRQKKAVQS